MLGAAREVDDDLAERTRRLGTAYAGATQEELLVDYTRLFLGPYGRSRGRTDRRG
jgi:hypothetical protein